MEKQLRDAGLRVTNDYRAEKLGSKIRDAQLDLVPYMFVLGPRDAEQETVSVRDRIEGDLGAMTIAAAVARLTQEITSKTLRHRVSSSGVSEASSSGPNLVNEY